MISPCDLHNIRISELVLILGSDIWDLQLSSNTALRIVHFLKNNNWKVGLKKMLDVVSLKYTSVKKDLSEKSKVLYDRISKYSTASIDISIAL